MVPRKLNNFTSAALRLRTLKLRNHRPIVSFTFDDFPRSAVRHGARLLEEAGVRGTFYMASALCDSIEDGIDYYGHDDVRELIRAGHELGCQTASHAPVSGLSKRQLIDELKCNENFAAQHYGDVVLSSFAYPFGSVDPRSKILLQNRFSSCRGVRPGVNAGTVDLGLVRAVSLYEQLLDRIDLRRILERLRPESWLVFYTHDVDDLPSGCGVSPDLLAYTIETAQQTGHEILTVQDALDRAALANS